MLPRRIRVVDKRHVPLHVAQLILQYIRGLMVKLIVSFIHGVVMLPYDLVKTNKTSIPKCIYVFFFINIFSIYKSFCNNLRYT